MSANTFVVIFVLFCLTAACRAVDIDALGSNPDDWLASHKSPFNAFFDRASGSSGHNEYDVVCFPKVFQVSAFEPTSGRSMVQYVDGSKTRQAMHMMSSKPSIDRWEVDFFQPDSGTVDVYMFNSSACRHRKFKGNYSDICFGGLTLNKTFTIGLNPSAVKVNLWLSKSSRMQYLLTAKENLPIVGNWYSTIYYHEASTTIDEKVFIIPSYCPKPPNYLNFN